MRSIDREMLPNLSRLILSMGMDVGVKRCRDDENEGGSDEECTVDPLWDQPAENGEGAAGSSSNHHSEEDYDLISCMGSHPDDGASFHSEEMSEIDTQCDDRDDDEHDDRHDDEHDDRSGAHSSTNRACGCSRAWLL
eukprot:1463834-Prymnesium_polylepis.1